MFADHNDLPLFLHWFSNDNVGIINNFIIWMNVFGAIYGGFWAGRAAHAALLKSDKVNMARVAALAGIFAVAYFLLLFDEINPADWQMVMMGVSLLAWIFVWAFPARAVAKQNQLISDKVEEEIKARMKLNLDRQVWELED